jgi:predicted secreted protein
MAHNHYVEGWENVNAFPATPFGIDTSNAVTIVNIVDDEPGTYFAETQDPPYTEGTYATGIISGQPSNITAALARPGRWLRITSVKVVTYAAAAFALPLGLRT